MLQGLDEEVGGSNLDSDSRDAEELVAVIAALEKLINLMHIVVIVAALEPLIVVLVANEKNAG